jgi:hypothetical protein
MRLETKNTGLLLLLSSSWVAYPVPPGSGMIYGWWVVGWSSEFRELQYTVFSSFHSGDTPSLGSDPIAA